MCQKLWKLAGSGSRQRYCKNKQAYFFGPPCSWKVLSVRNNSVTGNEVYLHSFSRCCLPNMRTSTKFRENLKFQLFKVIQGRWFWHQSKAHNATHYYTVSQKSMLRYLFGTVVTETTGYWIGVSFFHLTYFVQHHYLGNHTTWKFANLAINYCK